MTHHQPEKIEALVRDALPGARLRLEWFEEIDSTNTYLLAQPDVDKRVVLTECQTLGRGRRGRRWSAPPSSSVMLSLGWHLGGRSPSGLSLVVGLAIVDALAGLGVRGVGLKWPNDLVTESGKLGGVLVELNGERSVLGMGINVNIPTSSELGITQPFTDLNSMGYLPDRDACC